MAFERCLWKGGRGKEGKPWRVISLHLTGRSLWDKCLTLKDSRMVLTGWSRTSLFFRRSWNCSVRCNLEPSPFPHLSPLTTHHQPLWTNPLKAAGTESPSLQLPAPTCILWQLAHFYFSLSCHLIWRPNWAPPLNPVPWPTLPVWIWSSLPHSECSVPISLHKPCISLGFR